jgi:hypothetical protein
LPFAFLEAEWRIPIAFSFFLKGHAFPEGSSYVAAIWIRRKWVRESDARFLLLDLYILP